MKYQKNFVVKANQDIKEVSADGNSAWAGPAADQENSVNQSRLKQSSQS